MIWQTPSLTSRQTALIAVWASLSKFRQLAGRKEGSRTNRSGIKGCIEWPAATGVLYSHLKWAGQLWVMGTDTYSMWFWVADILSGCCQQQLMKTSRVTVGKARTRSKSPFSMLRNKYFCSINIVLKYLLLRLTHFWIALGCYVSCTTAVAIILSLFYDHMRVNVPPLV